MVVHTRISVEDVTRHFVGLEDPRSAINQRHPLVSVVVISLMAVLSGAGGPTGSRSRCENRYWRIGVV